jgi:hypothetical protein
VQGGVCPPGAGCFCTSDKQCHGEGGACLSVRGQNDLSCGDAGCTGTGTPDGFNCALASPGIPSQPTTVYPGFNPSNFHPSNIQPPYGDTTDCNATYDSTRHAFTVGQCSGAAPTIFTPPVGAANVGGPTVDILAFRNLTIASTSTLRLTGASPVILAVYGNASVLGIIDASAHAGVAGPGGDNATFCGGGMSSTGDDQCPGGGAGRAINGASGAADNGSCSSAPGIAPPPNNSNAVPLVAGCIGGQGGSAASPNPCGFTSGGAGGGGIQLSAAGSVTISGTILSSGSDGQSASVTVSPLDAGSNSGCGGAGGGSAGDILIEGSSVILAGAVIANGGAGGSGSQCDCTGGQVGMGGKGGTNIYGSVSGPTAPYVGLGGQCVGMYQGIGCSSSSASGNGGGGGSYGFIVVNTLSNGTPSKACETSLTPPPALVSNTCLCAADSDCTSGKCANASGQCTGTCSGPVDGGAIDPVGCEVVSASPTSWACPAGSCSNVTSASGTCDDAGVACWCTSDDECPGGACGNWPGCAAGSCTGVASTYDSFHCTGR